MNPESVRKSTKKGLKWVTTGRMLVCTCGCEHFSIMDVSSRHNIAVDPMDIRIACVRCGESIPFRGYVV